MQCDIYIEQNYPSPLSLEPEITVMDYVLSMDMQNVPIDKYAIGIMKLGKYTWELLSKKRKLIKKEQCNTLSINNIALYESVDACIDEIELFQYECLNSSLPEEEISIEIFQLKLKGRDAIFTRSYTETINRSSKSIH